MTLRMRPIRPEEADLFGQYEADAFSIPQDRVKEFVERDIRPNVDTITRALIDEKEQLKVVLELVLMPLWLGGKALPMLGIAGVATPPESRWKLQQIAKNRASWFSVGGAL